MQRLGVRFAAGCLWLAALACEPMAPTLSAATAALLGQDKDHTVSAKELLNHYTSLTADASAGSAQLQLGSVSALSGVAAGSILFIIQTQGAQVDTIADGLPYGQILNLGNTGHYELVTVVQVGPTGVKVSGHGAGGGLQFDYTMAGHTQVIAVPQWQTLTVAQGGTLTAPTWDGNIGGVVVVAADTLQLDGAISANGIGFRGGQLANGSGSNTAYYGSRTTDNMVAGAQGEGIGGGPGDFAQYGIYGRGAAANGGGGGNLVNSPGGGGANGLAMGKQWTGQGVMDVAMASYRTAWALDPTLDKANPVYADSAGGGRGGYGCSNNMADPTMVAPLDPMWGCGHRPATGGLGGRPLVSDVRKRLFLGGGGGAGQANNNLGGVGGNGGGLVFVMARTISGQGQVTADGENGANGGGVSQSGDGPGGAGGGGTVVLMAQSISKVQVTAKGGVGGNNTAQGNEAEGGGGGGGGGFVAIVGPSAAQVDVSGGAAGVTAATTMSTFPMDGATGGGSGAISQTAALGQSFLPPTYAIDLAVTLGLGASTQPSYTTAPVVVTVNNLGLDVAGQVTVTINLSMPIPATIKDSGAAQCSQVAQTVTCTLASLAAHASTVIELDLSLPREPQGAFSISAAVSGVGLDYDLTNNQAMIADAVAGYVQYGGNGAGCAAVPGGAAGPAGLAVLLFALFSALLRRRAAPLLWAGCALWTTVSGCSPPSPTPPVNLQVMVAGQGTVSADKGGLSCGATCQATYDSGTQVVLTAQPHSGQRFVSWDGRCQGAGPTCTVTLLADVQVTAQFAKLASSCANNQRDGDETDIDCGGSCGRCDDGRVCATASDCLNAQCLSGQCSSCPINKELVLNGGAEDGPDPTMVLPGWTGINGEVGGRYSGPGLPGPGSTPNPGLYLFYGGNSNTGSATQGLDLRACAPLIDKDLLSYTLFGYLGGFDTQDDNAQVVILFQDSQLAMQGSDKIGPIKSVDRGGTTGFVSRSAMGNVPVDARYVSVTLTSTKLSGNTNDGYADNISFQIQLK